MRFSIPLWFGTLKVKREHHLRPDERRREVPMIQIGDNVAIKHYIIWRSNKRPNAPAK